MQLKSAVMSKSVRIEGLRELTKALNDLPDRVAKNGLRAAVYAGAKVIRTEARQRAPVAESPVRPGQPKAGTLRRAIIMKHLREQSGQHRQTFAITVRRGRKYRNQGKKKNSSQDAWYWHFIEFGTVKMAARPFLRPALESKRVQAVTAIKDKLAERIRQEVTRLATSPRKK